MRNTWIEYKLKNENITHRLKSVNKYKHRRGKITIDIFNKHTNLNDRRVIKEDELEYMNFNKWFM